MELAKHRATHAIIMAAGIGKRLRPLTITTPKPLIKVNNVRIIDSVVKGLRINGIEKIYVVVGHLKEQFYKWASDSCDLEIIENPYYDKCNNISSLYVAREHIGESIIIDADQIVYNANTLDPCFSLSGYNALWCKGETREWLMKVENGVVQSCSLTGGSNGWQLFSVSRWSAEDGEKMKEHIKFEFERGNTQIYWDNIPMSEYFKEYTLGIHKMKKGDIVEVDEIEELVKIDNSYSKYLTC